MISRATVIDGVSERAHEERSIWIEDGRIKAIGGPDELRPSLALRAIDARGKFVIPGLMNANVHLLCDISLENLTRYMERYEELIAEAAQIALKNGLTTVFDTWGPRRPLCAVRDRINAGKLPGSRIFCAGNVIGWDGPFSHDFNPKVADIANPALVNRINAIWVANVGRHLMWLTPEEVAQELRTYIGKGVDFIKYGANEHFGSSAGAFLQFSPRVQRRIVDEAHRAGLTAQAHTMSVEGLWLALEAGCDLIQHANHTGPRPIPEVTLERMARQQTGTVIFPMPQRRLEWLMKNESHRTPLMWQVADKNARNLIRSGAPVLLANDGVLLAPETLANPKLINFLAGPWEDNLFSLSSGHFTWLEAMEEKECAPMQILQAATRNIARAYGKEKDLGSIEPGKIADLLILDKNPLVSAKHYRSIHTIIKEGEIVDREALPLHPMLTAPTDPPVEEEAGYVAPLAKSGAFPCCPMCEIGAP